MLKPGGDRVNVPDVDNVTARTLTSMTGTLTFDAATEGTTVIIVDTLAYFAFKVDDAAQVQNIMPLFESYTEKGGISLAIKVDTDGFTALDGSTNTKGTDAVAVTDDLIRDTMNGLNSGDNPDTERYFVVHPNTYGDLLAIDKYQSSLYAASSGVLKPPSRGYAGRIYNNDLYMTTNTPSGTSGKKNFMFHKSGCALIMQKEINISRRFPHDELAEALRIYTMYGWKLMRSASVYEVDGN